MTVLDQSLMLCNRIRKNQRRLRPWLKQHQISCYRLYDRDIPEIPLTVDWYEGRLHVSQWERSGSGNKTDTTLFIAALADSLAIPPNAIYWKTHRRQRNGFQYEKMDAQKKRFTISEGGHRFEVNLSDYLNTGLFLDHRITRQMVQEEAKAKRFLNLFGYTGAFTVYAAAGGAVHTTTIDMSNTYLRWAKANLRRNGFEGVRHRFLRDDVLAFLRHTQPQRMQRFDLVVIDPPTASKSKRMSHDLDIQRDYPFILNKTLDLCRVGALVFFSTNFKKFKFNPKEIDCREVTEITEQTIPFDFRDKSIHRAWRLIK